MVHLHNGLLHSTKKEGTPTFYDNMNKTGDYYAKWNKPGGKRQRPYDLTYKRSLINNINTQSRTTGMKICNRKKEGAPTLCNWMDGTGEYYAKWNKPGSEKQIPYDISYNWNLMNKINKQKK